MKGRIVKSADNGLQFAAPPTVFMNLFIMILSSPLMAAVDRSAFRLIPQLGERTANSLEMLPLDLDRVVLDGPARAADRFQPGEQRWQIIVGSQQPADDGDRSTCFAMFDRQSGRLFLGGDALRRWRRERWTLAFAFELVTTLAARRLVPLSSGKQSHVDIPSQNPKHQKLNTTHHRLTRPQHVERFAINAAPRLG